LVLVKVGVEAVVLMALTWEEVEQVSAQVSLPAVEHNL
jgi:hypothetical protein